MKTKHEESELNISGCLVLLIVIIICVTLMIIFR